MKYNFLGKHHVVPSWGPSTEKRITLHKNILKRMFFFKFSGLFQSSKVN